jgi:2-polyprenyl-6-methoxyphenol hydroxylase-like FAD-dependent oxidoreductase
VRAEDPRDPTDGDPSRLLPMFAGFVDPVPALLAEMPPASDVWFSPIEEVPPTWSTGRVVLVGDAAHASSPNMAEGASLALEDALVLAELLATAEGGIEAALTAFAARRTPRVAWVHETTHRRDRLRYLSPVLRRVTMRVAGARTFGRTTDLCSTRLSRRPSRR